MTFLPVHTCTLYFNGGTLHKLHRYGHVSEPMAKDVLYIGIDLGTFRSVMVSSDSHEVEELTVIGTPKDLSLGTF